jgi:hypothetical protein
MNPVKSAKLVQRYKKIGRLMGRYSYVLFRRVFPSRRDWLRANVLPGEATPFSLLQECGSDLSTALHHMGQRVDALPFLWCSPFGGSVVDSNGNLAPNTRTLACMKDMQHLESQFPTATGFDWEMFRIGWEAGAKWGECNPYKAEQARNTWNSPESRSIAGSTTGPLEDWRAK